MAARENSRALPQTRVRNSLRVFSCGRGGGGWTVKEQTTQRLLSLLHKSEIHIILKEEDKD